MIDVIKVGNALMYAAIGPDGAPRCTWPWTSAPESVRKAYRKRPDFWGVTPFCIALEWINKYR